MASPAVAIAGGAHPLGSIKKLEAPPVPKGAGERYWRDVRRAVALPRDYIHMSTGTTGSQPELSLNNLAVYNLYKTQDPRDWQANLSRDFPDLFPFQSGSATTARQPLVADIYGANQTPPAGQSDDTARRLDLVTPLRGLTWWHRTAA